MVGGRTERIAAETRAVFARLADGDGVIVDTRNAFYFGLNKTGAFLWQQLAERGGATVAELATALTQRFDVAQPDAERDASEFIARLVEHGLANLQNESKAAGD